MRKRLGWAEATLLLVAGGWVVAGCEGREGWPWVRNMFDHPGPVSQEDPLSPPESVLPADMGSPPGHPLPGWPEPAKEVRVGERGKLLFERYCAVCHGGNGRGRELTKDYFTPDLTEAEYVERLDEDIHSVILEGGLNMPAYRDALSEQEARLVVEHLRLLQGADEE